MMPYKDPSVGAYRARLYPWAIIRLLPKLQRTVVGQFRSRSDAMGHLRCLRMLMPEAAFIVIFERPLEVPTQEEEKEPVLSVGE
ncbi:hypothetical protein [Lusitaniella coriacea]|uniref:hypothetical protein n=1 Tax=Lusitaniella coriacea TaxID=1983105 RepID=UPI003CEC19D1